MLKNPNQEDRAFRTSVKRPPFLLSIEEAWKACIDRYYNTHHVLSERTLQAAFWSQLSLLADDRFVFIEPTIEVGDKTFVPDLVVCRKRSVIAFIEIKFAPRGAPDVSADLAKLVQLAQAKGSTSVKLERFLGVDAVSHRYEIGALCQYGIAYVSSREPRGLAEFLNLPAPSAIHRRAFVLSATTKLGDKAVSDTRRF